MMATTDLGYPYYAGTDSPAGHTQQQALAEAVDAMPGISSLTGTEIAALAGAELRAGRVVWNETTGTLQRSDGADWENQVSSATITTITVMTQAAYTALTPKLSTVLYVIVG
jgi:hypothetical protein